MKKFNLLAIVVLLALTSTAQRTQFGLKGGVNIANLKDDSNNTDSKIGFHIGGLAHIHVNQNFAVQPELIFSQQGAEYSFQETRLNYINMPILIQYMNKGLRIQTGPQLGVLVSHDIERNDGTDVDFDDYVDNFDFSWSLGAGYLMSSGLGVDARYNHGISNITNDAPYDAKNRVWQIGLFYQFKR